jgi:hypothetical protein
MRRRPVEGGLEPARGLSPAAAPFSQSEGCRMSIVEQDPPEWEDFEAAAKRPLDQHLRNSFIKTYKPVLDDADYRSFDTMEEYRQWRKDNLPAWLGYNRDQPLPGFS